MLKDQMVLPVGAIIRGDHGERYMVEAVLGVGGFSAVYRVRDRQASQKIFALKEVINPDKEDRRTLSTESQLLMRLNNPSLPRVYQVFEHTKLRRLYLLMDYIEGHNLEELRGEQEDNSFSLDFALALMSPIVKAVSYLHTQKPPIVHRDIKPANIIIPRAAGEAILVDFGLAKEYVEEKTTNILRYGTPGYAAPEQYAQGTNLRTDIYGLAATLYTLLTGIRPIDALLRIVNEDGIDRLKLADQVSSKIPASVGKVLSRAMSLRSDARYTSVDEFWQALSFASEHPTWAEENNTTPAKSEVSHAELERIPTANLKTGPGRATKRRHRPNPLWIAIPIVALLAILSISFFWLPSFQRKSVPGAHRPPLTTNIVNVCAPPTVSTLPTSDYPLLEPCYAGTINDIGVAKAKTPMYLTEIKQTQNTLSGRFRGLNVTGVFRGTIAQNGDLQLVVTLDGRADTVLLNGNSKYGGDIRGNFEVHDKNGQATLDEYGSWYVQPFH